MFRPADGELRILVLSMSPILRAGLRHIILDLFPKVEVFCSGFNDADGLNADILVVCFDKANQNESERMIRDFSNKFPLASLLTYDQTDFKEVFLNSVICDVKGYISDRNSVEDLRNCIEAVLDGKRVYDNEKLIDFILAQRPVAGVLSNYKHLSRREKQIFELLMQGMRPLEIARHLGKSVSTISTVKANLFRKMGVSNVVDLSRAFGNHSH